jgi:hypothetical protein
MRAALQRIRRLNLTDQPYRAPWCVAIDPPFLMISALFARKANDADAQIFNPPGDL